MPLWNSECSYVKNTNQRTETRQSLARTRTSWVLSAGQKFGQPLQADIFLARRSDRALDRKKG